MCEQLVKIWKEIKKCEWFFSTCFQFVSLIKKHSTIAKTQQYLHNRSKGLQIYWKESPTEVFFCEISEIFKNTLFYGKPPVAAPNI